MDLHAEVAELTRDIVRLDTSNSFGTHDGNETLVARHLAEYLEDVGIGQPQHGHRREQTGFAGSERVARNENPIDPPARRQVEFRRAGAQ